MTITAELYSNYPLNLLNDSLSSMNNDIKVALLADTYTPAQETHTSWDDVSVDEVTGTGYSAGGQSLTSETITEATRVTTFDADNVSWTNSTITAMYAVIYDNTPVDDVDKKLVGWIDFGENKSSENGTFEIQWDSAGILTFTVPAV